MNKIKVTSWDDVPKNFTGVAEFPNGNKHWFKEGRLHRLEGPAIEYSDGSKEWWFEGQIHRTDGPAIEYRDGTNLWYIEDCCYFPNDPKDLIENSIYLGKEKGNYNLYWLKFLTDKGIKEFPIVPGMESYKHFACLFDKVFGAPIT
ncbi:MAG TPA: hypothetical protein PLP33_07225 [Leptospiraceae bacterium]|nr:hypothetical protein [Leptospiraceae bacterium]